MEFRCLGLRRCLYTLMIFLLATTVFLYVSDLGFLLRVSTLHPPVSLSGNSTSGVRLYVGVLSSAANYLKRMAVRRTWGSHTGLQRVVFVVANPGHNTTLLRSIRKEAVKFQDLILVGHIQEHYNNITQQTLEVFRSAYAYNRPVTHVLKCDDDSYVHVEGLLSFLANQSLHRTYLGHMNNHYIPNRNPQDKWYVAKEEWHEDVNNFSWANGPGYVLTKDLADEIATGAAYGCSRSKLFKLEDIALASWIQCLRQEYHWNIQTVHTPHINIVGCAPDDIVSHYRTPTQMDCMFAENGTCC